MSSKRTVTFERFRTPNTMRESRSPQLCTPDRRSHRLTDQTWGLENGPDELVATLESGAIQADEAEAALDLAELSPAELGGNATMARLRRKYLKPAACSCARHRAWLRAVRCNAGQLTDLCAQSGREPIFDRSDLLVRSATGRTMLASQITEINVRSRQPHPRASSIVDVDLPAGTIQKAELHW